AGSARHLDQATRTIVKKPGLRSYLNILSDKLKRADKAEHRFVAKSSLHFRVKFNGVEDYFLWDKVLDILEEAYREIGQKFGYFPEEAITVVLHTQQTFQAATGSPAWADGLYDSALGRIQIPTQGALTNREWLRKVLRHEFVHALLHQRMGTRGRVPQWLNEGLAMQLAGDDWPDLDQVIDAEVTLIPLNSLEGSWGGFPGNLATMAYLEGNSATRFLIERFGMERARAIVDTLAQGKPIGAAIKDRLFMDYQAFQEQWIVNLNEKLRGGNA
ncbi:MAG: peptidase MA family metallohydrolase, partial [Nitrospirales bacterium]